MKEEIDFEIDEEEEEEDDRKEVVQETEVDPKARDEAEDADDDEEEMHLDEARRHSGLKLYEIDASISYKKTSFPRVNE